MMTTQSLEMSLIATNQISGMSLIPAELSLIPVGDASLNLEAVKRTRGESPPEMGEESQKKSKKQFNQIPVIKDQQLLETSQKEVIEDLKRKLFNSEKKHLIWEKTVSEQMKVLQEQFLDMEKKHQHATTVLTQTITSLKVKISNTQKQVALVQRTINIAPQEGEIVTPVTQISPKLTVEEEEEKSRKEYDYGYMKGNEGWDPSKTEEPTQEEEIMNTTSAKRTAKALPQPMSFIKAVKSGVPPSQMTQKEYVEKSRKIIQLVKDPCLSLLQKEKCDKEVEITSMTIRIKLNTTGQTCPLVSARKIIQQTVGMQPLNISKISPTLFQILHKTEDTVSFQKLLIPNRIEAVEAKTENFQQWDVDRIAHLYLRGYFKELARAAIQDLPTRIQDLVLVRAEEIVVSTFRNKILQKKWMFNIKKDRIALQSASMEMDGTSS
jgi:hypothetical protein